MADLLRLGITRTRACPSGATLLEVIRCKDMDRIASRRFCPQRYKVQRLEPPYDMRLIGLFPSPAKFTEIRCRMWAASLDDYPKYDGMSYFWGGKQEEVDIRINGLLFGVPKSLLSDLRNLTSKWGGVSRILFVDSLAFDTDCPREQEIRHHLIPLTFKQSQQVAIGLGDKNPDDASAIELVKQVASL